MDQVIITVMGTVGPTDQNVVSKLYPSHTGWDSVVDLPRTSEPSKMPKDRFVNANPYQELKVSDEERLQLIELVNGFMEDHFHKYEDFVVVDKHQVDDQRWKLVRSKDNQHVYAERSKSKDKSDDIPVVLSVGTLVGDVDDVMFGVVNPTLDVMRVKASYVHDLDSAAVLCPVVEPSAEEPFRSLIIKWMIIDVPLQSTSLVKSRDFVYIEATGIVHFANGDRVGYHLLHSIDFPQTKPLPNMIRGNLSVFGFFRQLTTPSISTRAMKKLSWMLQHRHSAVELQRQQRGEKCVMCDRKVTTGIRGFIGASTCKICYGCVCYACKIRKRISFIALDNQLIQRKVSFCAKCVNDATKWDAQEAARDQAAGYRAYKAFSTSSQSDTRSTSETSMFD